MASLCQRQGKDEKVNLEGFPYYKIDQSANVEGLLFYDSSDDDLELVVNKDNDN